MTLPLFESYRESVTKIPLTQGQFALVDACDYPLVSQYNWFAQWNRYSKTFYAISYCDGHNGKNRTHLHRMILGITDPHLDVNHFDHNGLNCCRRNLKACTRSQNAAYGRKRRNNTSGYKGVTFHKQSGKWRATICFQYKHLSCGLFREKSDAARAYDKKAIELFGEFSHLNFSRSDYS